MENVAGVRVLRGFLVFLCVTTAAFAQEPPQLTQPVNDFANIVDEQTEQALDALIRSLQQATGDAVIVATVDTVAPYANIQEYAVKMFENGGRGIGQRGKDNGVLIVVAVQEREVRVEVGYDLEEFITDGFAGDTSREVMVPEFRRGAYGAGLLAGVSRIIGRIADRRNVSLQGLRPSPDVVVRDGSDGSILLTMFIIFMVLNAIAGRMRRGRRGIRRWGGGGFGGGFGGFGGGRSGGGGGGGSW